MLTQVRNPNKHTKCLTSPLMQPIDLHSVFSRNFTNINFKQQIKVVLEMENFSSYFSTENKISVCQNVDFTIVNQ